MLTMNPTLLIGPADWDPARLPQEEFDARIAALWRANPSAAGAIVYGDRANHAELAYLTNFTPKLEAALALIPRQGAPQLLVGGGANMLPAAKPLTFVEACDRCAMRQRRSHNGRSEHGGDAPVLIGSASCRTRCTRRSPQRSTSRSADKTADFERSCAARAPANSRPCARPARRSTPPLPRCGASQAPAPA